MSDTYILTGANGHLGSTILQKLVERGESVRALVLPGERLPVEDGRAEIFYGNVCDRDSMEPLFSGVEGGGTVVIHTAGIVSIATKFMQKVYDVNVEGTKNVVELCQTHGVKKLIYVSSVHAIPEKPAGETIEEISDFDPDKVKGFYAKTKAMATRLVLDGAKRGLNASVVHPSGIVGPNDYGNGHTTQMIIDYVKARLTACIKGGYDFVDVRDVADGILSCCERGKQGECYILSNSYYSVRDLIFNLHEITGRKMIKTILPTWFAKLTAPFAELYYMLLRQTPLYTAYSISTLGSNASFSHEKAQRELNFKPRGLKESLKDTVAWLKSQGRL